MLIKFSKLWCINEIINTFFYKYTVNYLSQTCVKTNDFSPYYFRFYINLNITHLVI